MKQSHTVRPKSSERPKSLKSSLQARKLIRAALKITKGNQSAAARLLKLPNQGQLRRMLLGEIKDTPSMLLALQRAERRYYNLKHDAKPHQQAALNQGAIETARGLLAQVDKVLKGLHDEPATDSGRPLRPTDQPAANASQDHTDAGP
jgi:hypothetical protein